MATFSERLRSLRREKNWSQQRLAEELKLSKSSVNMYERGEREPSFETTEAIADLFNVDMDFLYGRTDIRHTCPAPHTGIGSLSKVSDFVPPGFDPMPDMDQVPLIGRIACGQPITAEENVEELVSIPSAWHAQFTLRCEGDSMEPRIKDGDLVAIRSQPIVENGEIAAVRIGCEATLKHVYLYKDKIILQPENPSYEPIVKIGEEMNEVHIEGRAVGLCRGI